MPLVEMQLVGEKVKVVVSERGEAVRAFNIKKPGGEILINFKTHIQKEN